MQESDQISQDNKHLEIDKISQQTQKHQNKHKIGEFKLKYA